MFVTSQKSFYRSIDLTSVIGISGPDVKICILSSAPESPCPYIEASIIRYYGGTVEISVIYRLQLGFNLYIRTDLFDQVRLEIPDTIVSDIDKTSPVTVHSMAY